jgi:hypothetical protein
MTRFTFPFPQQRTEPNMKLTTSIIAAAAAALIVAGCAAPMLPPEPEPTRTQGETDAVLVPGERTRAQIVAKDYIGYAGFSESGLAAQLTYEGFTGKAAAWAAANSGADWDQEAAQAAGLYRSSDVTMSRKAMIEQLKFEGFTSSQATRGADSAGY